MSFTDDDLNRLKERMEIIPGIVWASILGNNVASQCFDLRALLARLEAAEIVLNSNTVLADEKYKAWCEARGK